MVESGFEFDAARASHQQAEGDGLRVAVGELRVRGFGEKQLAPIDGERGQGGAFQRELFGHLLPQEATEARAHFRQLLGVARRDGLPAQEVFDEAQQFGRRGEACAGAFDVSDEANKRAFNLPVAPEAEAVAVGVKQVGQRLQFLPLLLVVASEAARVCALARRFDFDEADERLANGDGVIRARLELAQGRFANSGHVRASESTEFRQVGHKPSSGARN